MDFLELLTLFGATANVGSDIRSLSSGEQLQTANSLDELRALVASTMNENEPRLTAAHATTLSNLASQLRFVHGTTTNLSGNQRAAVVGTLEFASAVVDELHAGRLTKQRALQFIELSHRASESLRAESVQVKTNTNRRTPGAA